MNKHRVMQIKYTCRCLALSLSNIPLVSGTIGVHHEGKYTCGFVNGGRSRLVFFHPVVHLVSISILML